ncbi:MAG: hypothetical protein M3462_14355 [Chloroflexota bacterium]|nr:hypothetical protein [Chloroflexota bacterium]
MVYKATQDVVHRVMPLLDRLSDSAVEKARLLTYLSARAGEDWGVLDRVDDETSRSGRAEGPDLGDATPLPGPEIGAGSPGPGRVAIDGVAGGIGVDALGRAIRGAVTFRDRASGATHLVEYPAALPAAIEGLVVAEYKRLATGERLTTMAKPLFDHFFAARYCDRCRWSGPEHAQFHRECHFAANPANFEPRTPFTGGGTWAGETAPDG